jgi:hypothetical protein
MGIRGQADQPAARRQRPNVTLCFSRNFFPRRQNERPKRRGSISVYLPGTKVTLGKAPAQVVGVCIAGEGVTYQCVWWSGSDRKEAWVKECEVMPMLESEWLEVSSAG